MANDIKSKQNKKNVSPKSVGTFLVQSDIDDLFNDMAGKKTKLSKKKKDKDVNIEDLKGKVAIVVAEDSIKVVNL